MNRLDGSEIAGIICHWRSPCEPALGSKLGNKQQPVCISSQYFERDLRYLSPRNRFGFCARARSDKFHSTDMSFNMTVVNE